MKRILVTATILIAAGMGFSGSVQAVSHSFDCDTSDPNTHEEQLSDTISNLDIGDTLTIMGTCHVNLLIRADVNDITLDGQGTAFLIGPDPLRDVVRVEGKSIVIKGFDISGGHDGVHVHWGGHMSQLNQVAGLEDNVIHDTSGRGVIIHGNSSVKMINNVIYDNPGPGIVVSESSAARIGTLGLGGTSHGANTIEDNGAGILVERGSTANIVGNDLLDNRGPGLKVSSGSQAHAIGNNITDNDGFGISTAGSSTMRIADNTINDNGGGVIVGKNAKATLQNNVGIDNGVALVCRIAGVVDGNLAGLIGLVETDETCVVVLDDY